MRKDLKTKWDLSEASKILSESYEAKGDWKNAFHYLAEHKKYADSIFV